MVTRFLCSSCERLAPASSFRIDAGELLLVCGRCGGENLLERSPAPTRVVPLRPVDDAVGLARDAAEAADPFAVPADRCPKCIGTRHPEGLSCPHCGLVYVNFRPEDTAPSAELAAALRAALGQWDDPPAHERALRVASTRGELPALGRFYRLRLAAAPLDPVAQRGRDEVLKIASAAPGLVAPKAPVDLRERRWRYLGAAMLLAAAAGLAMGLVRQFLRM